MNFILNNGYHNIHNITHLILVINIIKININIPFKGSMYNAFFDVHQTFNVYLTHIRPGNFLMNNLASMNEKKK